MTPQATQNLTAFIAGSALAAAFYLGAWRGESRREEPPKPESAKATEYMEEFWRNMSKNGWDLYKTCVASRSACWDRTNEQAVNVTQTAGTAVTNSAPISVSGAPIGNNEPLYPTDLLSGWTSNDDHTITFRRKGQPDGFVTRRHNGSVLGWAWTTGTSYGFHFNKADAMMVVQQESARQAKH